MISEQVEIGFRRRDTEIVNETFRKYCDHRSNHSIIRNDKLPKALNDLGVYVQAKDLDEFLQEFDFTNKIGLDNLDFLSVLKKPTISEEWVKTLPIPEIIADAIPKISGIHPLEVVSELSNAEISVICRAVFHGLEKILNIASEKLKDAFTAMKKKDKMEGECKFSLLPMTCGTIKDFHSGIEGRIGASFGFVTQTGYSPILCWVLDCKTLSLAVHNRGAERQVHVSHGSRALLKE